MYTVWLNVLEFKCRDRGGVLILCTSDDWEHIIEHTECIGQQGLIKAVIEKPDSIYQDADYKNRRVLYKRLVLPHPWGSCYMRIVIEYRMTPIRKRGWVCTAFASYDKKEGGVLLWSK